MRFSVRFTVPALTFASFVVACGGDSSQSDNGASGASQSAPTGKTSGSSETGSSSGAAATGTSSGGAESGASGASSFDSGAAAGSPDTSGVDVSGSASGDSISSGADSGAAPRDAGSPGSQSGASVDSGSNGAQPGSASGGSSGSTSSCGVVPVDPQATPQAKALLCYLHSQYGNHILTGQQETSWDADPTVDVTYIQKQSGKYPAVLGQDFLYAPTTNGGGAESMNGAPAPSSTTSRAVAWWKAGGISEICYHMGAPGLSDSYNNAKTAVPGGIAAVTTAGTAANKSFLYKLDYAAAELAYLQANNVAVIYRPFHEAAGTWFWWSMGTGAQFVTLWKYVFNYFTQTKGLHNILWMLAYDGSPTSLFYPPANTVDLSGGDTYATNQPFGDLYSASKRVAGGTIPLALHETGTIPQPSACFNNNAAPWILFNTWCSYEQSQNTPATIKSAYADSHAITRDQLPSFK